MIRKFNEEEREAIKKNRNPQSWYGFVPQRLEIKNIPKYDNFPYNLLFRGFANIDGVDMTGSACYFPDLASYSEAGEKQVMTYYNQYSRDWTVKIAYDKRKGVWEGSKFNKGEYMGGGGGADWNMAFVHITASGLAKGEKVIFEKLTKIEDDKDVEA